MRAAVPLALSEIAWKGAAQKTMGKSSWAPVQLAAPIFESERFAIMTKNLLRQAEFAVARRREIFSAEAAFAFERWFRRPDDLVLRGTWRVARDRADYWWESEAVERYAQFLFDFEYA